MSGRAHRVKANGNATSHTSGRASPSGRETWHNPAAATSESTLFSLISPPLASLSHSNFRTRCGQARGRQACAGASLLLSLLLPRQAHVAAGDKACRPSATTTGYCSQKVRWRQDPWRSCPDSWRLCSYPSNPLLPHHPWQQRGHVRLPLASQSCRRGKILRQETQI
ncbi:hypothetical protein GQ55_5G425400 [Panicum hallii var. hallii]|uniref:Uncharacterized protein n=1 Tax=Panicum hallii var. hallii TaxID=1504633 RepID=A0A2T7DP66_9POAL|nr:hypothetical protein GQ55_5G425400 [Panicum hallii var. hallii]